MENMSKDTRSSRAKHRSRINTNPRAGKTDLVDSRAFIVMFIFTISVPLYFATGSLITALASIAAIIALYWLYKMVYNKYIIHIEIPN